MSNSQRAAAQTTWKRTAKAERELKKELGSKYRTLHQGWPDVVAFRKDTGTFYFVECKRISEKRDAVDKILRPEQNEVRRMLRRIIKKMKYDIWFFEDKPGSTRIVEKAFTEGNKLETYWQTKANPLQQKVRTKSQDKTRRKGGSTSR